MTQSCPHFVVLSIDGVPHRLIDTLIARGDAPHLAALKQQAGLRPMRSVQPTVSCVAWSTYMTGKNPGKHGIYGFIDRQPDTYSIMLPNNRQMTAAHLWEMLSAAGRRVFGMNVPATYPPRPVNGVLIGGFLAPTLDKVAYPQTETAYLQQIDYRIDSDPALARRDKHAMLDDLHVTLDRRMEAMFHYLDAEPWDFFHTHIMGTDRINHFLWGHMEDDDGPLADGFWAYYRHLDESLGRLLERLNDDTPLLVFSDHGFCRIRYEVQLSQWLVQQGWTTPAAQLQHPYSIDPARSRAYGSIPGRLYLNLQGREPGGIVPRDQYQAARDELAADLLAWRDPQGRPVIDRVLRREDIYWPDGVEGPGQLTLDQAAGADGVFGRGPDLVAVPHDGYDLKLGLNQAEVFVTTQLEGMHTYGDASMLARNVALPEGDLEIMQVARAILTTLGVPVPADLDGAGAARTVTRTAT